jgi:phosphopantetheine adenylyltransferase
MVENAEIVERLSKVLGVPPDELVRKGIEEFLESQLRICYAEINETKTRHDVKSAAELEKKIRKGAVVEHPAWEDLIVLENLEERAQKIQKERMALKKRFKEQRKAVLEKTFGIDRDRIKPFSEEDRGEDRD